LATSAIFEKLPKEKNVPNRLKLAKSGHPALADIETVTVIVYLIVMNRWLISIIGHLIELLKEGIQP
jgi:hypothetical protein